MGLLLLLLLPLMACNGLGSSGSASEGQPADSAGSSIFAPAPASAVNPDFHLPSQVSLCGEPFDLSKRHVFERLEFEFVRVANHPAQIALWQRRAALFFPQIEAGLKAEGLPDDLKYLAVAESDLRPWIISPAGALGLWQFMPATARSFGLTVNKSEDHRRLPVPLFGAAQRYFKSLYAKFGSWHLAMAAYNGGDGRIGKAIAAQGTRNYADLDLPRETERYVYRIAAIKLVLENPAIFGAKKTVPEVYHKAEKVIERKVEVPKGTTWPQLAKMVGCDYKTLRQLNPHILQSSLSGSYLIRVPGK